MFFVVKRATLLIPSGPLSDPDRKHLFICLTDSIGTNNETLIVSVSTFHQGLTSDISCQLYAGDHSFIAHPSIVNYMDAQIVAASKLMSGVAQGKLIAKEPLDTAVFARVCKGLGDSRFTSPKILSFYQVATGYE